MIALLAAAALACPSTEAMQTWELRGLRAQGVKCQPARALALRWARSLKWETDALAFHVGAFYCSREGTDDLDVVRVVCRFKRKSVRWKAGV